MNSILVDCYESLANLGLSKKEARHILKEGLTGIELVQYIEKSTNKDFAQYFLRIFGTIFILRVAPANLGLDYTIVQSVRQG